MNFFTPCFVLVFGVYVNHKIATLRITDLDVDTTYLTFRTKDYLILVSVMRRSINTLFDQEPTWRQDYDKKNEGERRCFFSARLKHTPSFISMFQLAKILISGDVQVNPGPIKCKLCCRTIAKNN